MAGKATAAVEARLAAEAIRKTKEGEAPTRDEARALRRLEAAREERQREEYYRTVPKKHFVAMCGRATNSVNTMGRNAGLPVMGRTVDLYAVLSAVFAFFAENKHAISAIRSGGRPLDEAKQADMEWKQERTRATRLMRLEREGQQLPRDEVHEGLTIIAGIYRRAGARLRKQFGDDAYAIVEESWEDATRAIESRFGGEHDSNQRSNQELAASEGGESQGQSS